MVNPTGTTPRLEINTTGRGSPCGGENNDSVTIEDGEKVYLSGCDDGSAKVELRRTADNSLARTYSFTISEKLECKPVRGVDAERRTGTAVRLGWSSELSGGLTSTGRQVEVKKWVNNRWVHERTIDESASRNYSWHLGLDPKSWYTYRVRNICGGESSIWSGWDSVSPWLGGASGDDEDTSPRVTPTPTPSDYDATEPDEGGETPPSPRR